MKLREYQIELSDQAKDIVNRYWIVYLALEVRVWKTFISLETAKKLWCERVLFLTKLKAISSITKDYEYYKNDFDIQIINYESIHKLENNNFDLVICDEAHCLWSFPKPNNKFKEIKKRFSNKKFILLSGTPQPENSSQLFHQFYLKVWNDYKNFYGWAKDFVKVKLIFTSYWQSNDYSDADYEKIMRYVWKLMITYTQKEAWFTSEVEEQILYVEMKEETYKLANKLKRDKVIIWKTETILADTKVKEMQKLHQIFSWTIKFESWNSQILDTTKAEFIKEYFKWKKICIFYKFKEEKNLIKQVFGSEITDDLQNKDLNIMSQIVSWREGVNLSHLDYIVYLNIDFSAVSYWQSRARTQSIDRLKTKIYWIFSKKGLETLIYKSVQNKKNFTSKIYEKC
jgi:hypothetical protein